MDSNLRFSWRKPRRRGKLNNHEMEHSERYVQI